MHTCVQAREERRGGYSLCFVEFVRGKYDLRNRTYLRGLLARMTHVERERLLSMSFRELWYGFWYTDSSRNHVRDIRHAEHKFNTVRAGYFLRPHPLVVAGAGAEPRPGGAPGMDRAHGQPWVPHYSDTEALS